MNILFVLLLILSNLTSQSTKQKIEKFDFKTYEKYKENPEDLSSEYIKKDGTEVYMSKSSQRYFLRETLPEPYLFQNIKEFFKNGNLWKKYQMYKKGNFIVGIEYIYSENGELIKQIDHDALYTYSLYDVLNFCKQNHIEITEITRSDPAIDISFCWAIKGNYKFNGEEGLYQTVLDGKTGELVAVYKSRFVVHGNWSGTAFDDIVYQKDTQEKTKTDTLDNSSSSKRSWSPFID